MTISRTCASGRYATQTSRSDTGANVPLRPRRAKKPLERPDVEPIRPCPPASTARKFPCVNITPFGSPARAVHIHINVINLSILSPCNTNEHESLILKKSIRKAQSSTSCTRPGKGRGELGQYWAGQGQRELQSATTVYCMQPEKHTKQDQSQTLLSSWSHITVLYNGTLQ